MGKLLIGWKGDLQRANVRHEVIREMAFSYQEMRVSYQKGHFSYHLPLALGPRPPHFQWVCTRLSSDRCGIPLTTAPESRQACV